MPLTMAALDRPMRVVAVHIGPEARSHLENLGIFSGQDLTVVACKDGDLILRVKDSRLAVDRGVANGILVEEAAETQTLPVNVQAQSGNHESEHTNETLGLHSQGATKQRKKRGFLHKEV